MFFSFPVPSTFAPLLALMPPTTRAMRDAVSSEGHVHGFNSTSIHHQTREGIRHPCCAVGSTSVTLILTECQHADSCFGLQSRPWEQRCTSRLNPVPSIHCCVCLPLALFGPIVRLSTSAFGDAGPGDRGVGLEGREAETERSSEKR